MIIPDPIPFLANVIRVAYADGKLSASEMGQLESIRIELKFKKGDFNAAVRLVEQGDFRMTPVGSFVDQVRNLEMILRVAYADDDLGEIEASLISEFCKATGIYQDQLDKLRGDVLATLKQQGKICPSCGASADADSRFCPKCGSNLTSANESVQVEMQIPTTGLAVEFAESTAASFSNALEIAKRTMGFQCCERNKKSWYLAVYPSIDLRDAMPLIEALSGIRNRRVYVDGQEKSWDEVFGFAWCATRRSTAYRPVEYCFGKDENRLNPWGCKQSRMDWTEWATWFCFGRWEKAGMLGGKIQWRFDKERIRHELATNLFRSRFCPYMQAKLPEAVLRYMPDTVIPDTDSNWDYHRAYEQVPGSIKVTEKQTSGDFTYTNEFWADGVRPKGLRGFKDILSNALGEAGGNVLVADLLK